ncbi:MAG: CHAT domain-containing protein [Zoogloeaceae bacterium]|jgi:CHAT domain-containing protein|nr:CHAT domain-containing protein [Zoogloeaceae bacterium]
MYLRPGIKKILIPFFTALLLAAPCAADDSSAWMGMAASGRYDQLETTLEKIAAARALDTAERHALCFAYSRVKRYSRLFDCLDALTASIKKGDTETLLFGLSDATPVVNIMRADALIEMGQFVPAQKEAEKAVSWLKKNGSDTPDMLFNALAAQVLAYALADDRAKAGDIARQLADESTGFMGDYSSAKAFALARARMGLKDYAGVVAALREDRSFAVKVFLDRLVSASFFTGVNNWAWVELPRAFMLNKALLEIGEKEEARTGFKQLATIAQVRENGDIFWLLENELGQLAEDAGNFDEALVHYRAAIEVIERQRASINTEASKIGFIGDKQAVYARIVDLAQRRARPELAFEFIERAKSRALVDLLAAREDGKRGQAPTLAAISAADRVALTAFREAQADSTLQLPVDMVRAGGQTAGGRSLLTERASALQQQAPALASLVTVGVMSLDELQQFIGDNEVLLEYFAFGNTLYGLALSRQERLLLRLENDTLEADIRALRKEVEDLAAYPSARSQRLYRQLVAPFEKVVGEHDILIVPHGALHYLPFAALHDGRASLIAGHDLRFLPSVSTQKYLRPPRKVALDNMLLFGNPDLGNSEFDLPSAEDEANVIAKLVGNAQVLTRQRASETAFRAEARRYPYIHIASHGEFNADNALDSRLLLAADGEHDGLLTVRELYETTLDAELVTLSACETGLSQTLSGDDLVGLTRGFMYAGSSNIVASLWQVDDEATSRLMQDFYRYLKAGLSKRAALRKAQLGLLKDYPEPVFWAAFYLTGNGI